MFGPIHSVDFVHAVPNGKGAHDVYVFIRKDTFKTAWNRAETEPRLLEHYKQAAARNDRYIKRHQLLPLENIETDGIACDGNRILPINEDNHIVMKNGTVYDPHTKTFLHNRSTEIKGYVMKRMRLGKRAVAIVSSKATVARLGAVLALSAVIDTGFYEIGVYNGYRGAAKGKIPKRLLKAADKQKTPSDTRMILNDISPIPLTLKPLTENKTDLIHPTDRQLAQLRQAITQTSVTNQLSATA